MYGQSRTTRDIDIVTRLPLGNVHDVCRKFQPPGFYVSEDAAFEAVRSHTMFNIIENESGLNVDVVIPQTTAFERSQFKRARRLVTAPGYDPFFGSPEDVIISKMRFFKMGESDKHLADSAAIVRVQADDLDRGYVEHWARHFDLMDIWQAILKRVEQAP